MSLDAKFLFVNRMTYSMHLFFFNRNGRNKSNTPTNYPIRRAYIDKKLFMMSYEFCLISINNWQLQKE